MLTRKIEACGLGVLARWIFVEALVSSHFVDALQLSILNSTQQDGETMEDSRAIHLSQFRTRSERIHEPIKAWPPARTAKKNQTARDYDSMMNLTKPGFCYVDAMEESVDKHMNEIYSNYIRGVHRAAEMRILFAGLIRNAEASVWRSYLALKELGRHFADYRFLVLENDSDDQTSQKMREVARMDKKYEIRSETLGFGDERSLEAPRMRRMANLRNRLHKWVAEKFQSGERWDLIAMYDFDINLLHPHAFPPQAFFCLAGTGCRVGHDVCKWHQQHQEPRST